VSRIIVCGNVRKENIEEDIIRSLQRRTCRVPVALAVTASFSVPTLQKVEVDEPLE
jgi:hypothetical protein